MAKHVPLHVFGGREFTRHDVCGDSNGGIEKNSIYKLFKLNISVYIIFFTRKTLARIFKPK